MMSEAGIQKVLDDPHCLVCGSGSVQCAHLVPKSLGPKGYSEPDLIIPLCIKHHQQLDAHKLDILPYLSRAEELAAVKWLGIARAYRRLGGYT